MLAKYGRTDDPVPTVTHRESVNAFTSYVSIQCYGITNLTAKSFAYRHSNASGSRITMER